MFVAIGRVHAPAQVAGGRQGQEWRTTIPVAMTEAPGHAEQVDRRVRSIRYQMNAARFPIHRDLASFQFDGTKIDERLIRQFFLSEFDAAIYVQFLVLLMIEDCPLIL